MKSKNIIYGVPGMLEYQALINVGGAKMKIPFTNGSSNEAGRTPATFSTSNPIVQLAIENCKEFKSGLIHIVHSVETDNEVYIESEHVALQNETDNVRPFIEKEKTSASDTLTPEQPVATQSEESNNSEVPAEPEITFAEFTCNDDAKDFLETKFDVKRSTLRSRDAIVACGKSNGVNIRFID